MANISAYLAKIVSAIYGEDVRWSIHDAIELINDVSEVVFSTGTAVTSPTSSSTGFYEDSLYLNTNTYELWKCVGTDLWSSLGILKGDNGVGITSITKTSTAGLVDTYTILYTDGNTDTFDVTNGDDGTLWYRGTQISGKNPTPSVFPLSGITDAHPGDFYLNPSEGAVYYCVTGGAASVATWAYDFTMTGGGGADKLDDLTDVTITSGALAPGQILTYDDVSGKWINADPDKSFVRYGGALNFADLATYASTYLTSGYEDSFFLLRTGGTLTSADVDPSTGTWSSNFHEGDYIPPDSHIAVININRGTLNPPVYKYDDFGGFVDISGKADKSELDDFVANANVSSGSITFTGIDDTVNSGNCGYDVYIKATSASTNKNPTAQLSSISGEGTNNMTLTYTTDADNGTLTAFLRQVK